MEKAKELTEKDIERIVEKILRGKGIVNYLQNLAIKDDLKLLSHMMDKRFEEMLHYMDRRFGGINRRFEDINKRFEDINTRFEGLTHYIDKRFDGINKRINLLISLIFGFNIPILIGLITLILKTFL